ncbi:hypothetical protein CLAIMM_02108, partial [Cladophialophora immunda]
VGSLCVHITRDSNLLFIGQKEKQKDGSKSSCVLRCCRSENARQIRRILSCRSLVVERKLLDMFELLPVCVTRVPALIGGTENGRSMVPFLGGSQRRARNESGLKKSENWCNTTAHALPTSHDLTASWRCQRPEGADKISGF